MYSGVLWLPVVRYRGYFLTSFTQHISPYARIFYVYSITSGVVCNYFYFFGFHVFELRFITLQCYISDYNILHLIATFNYEMIIMPLGQRKNDEMCKPLDPHCSGFAFFSRAAEFFKQWKSSGRKGLTNETFLACIQSVDAMLALSTHLVQAKKFF